MWRYVIKRVVLAVFSVFIITTLTFFLMNAIPGGPFASEKAIPANVQAALEKRFNLDKPVFEQYLLYMKNILHGDFGVSMKTGRDVSRIIGEGFRTSAVLGGSAAILAIAGGLVLGCVAALTRNKWPDRLIIFLTTFATAIPSFVLATLLLLIFCLELKLLPVWSAKNPNYILPVISLAVYPMAYITRLTKTSMLDVLGQDYIRTAKAKGVSGFKTIFKHGLRNALIPVITYVGPMIAYIITGSLVVETVFTIGGLGTQFVTSITTSDYSVIMGTTIFLAVLIITASLISDLVYKLVDPRIKLD